MYHALQPEVTCSISESSETEDLASLDASITSLRKAITNARTTRKSLESEVCKYTKAQSPDELRGAIEALQTQKAGLVERIEELKQSEIKPISEQEKNQIDGLEKKWKREKTQRWRVLKELWWQVVEAEGAREGGLCKEELWVSTLCSGV